MAKLQKSRRQSERHSDSHIEERHQDASNEDPVKLTPAEIRATNNLSQAPKKSRHRRHSSHTRHARTLDRTTPPHSPTRGRSATAYEAQSKRASTMPMPTPPQSPVLYYSKIFNPQQNPPNFSVPRSSTPRHSNSFVANLTTARLSNSRSPVQTPPTYRGHDMTRNGSFTLMQRPSREIVGNPLSQFSRPRRSRSQAEAMSSSIPRDVHVCDHEPAEKPRSRSVDSSGPSKALNVASAPFDRNMSPVSFEANRSILDFSVGKPKRTQIAPSVTSHSAEEAQVATARPVSMVKPSPAKSKSFFSRFRRHSLQAQPQVPPHAHLPESTTPIRRSEEQNIPQSSVGGAAISAQIKGKQPEVVPASMPASPGVRCCAKCGRYKKPYNPADFGMTPLLEDQVDDSNSHFLAEEGRARPVSFDPTGLRSPGRLSNGNDFAMARPTSMDPTGLRFPDSRQMARLGSQRLG